MKTNLIIRFAFLIVVFLANTIQATEYYVNSSTGNDTNVGSENQPWKTIQKAANTLVAGDTVYIMAGTYLPTQQIKPLNSGTSDHYINYRAYPGEEHLVVIDGTDIPPINWFGVINISLKEYIKISGLKVVNSSFAGIFIDESTNIILENNHTDQTYSSGISAWSSAAITIDNNKIRRACWPTDGMQECISVVGSNHVVVKNNHIYDGGSIGFGGGGEGIDIKNGCTNVIVSNNLIHDIASVGIYVDAYEIDQSNVHVYNNTVYNISGVGVSVASEEGGSLKNVIVNNNIIYNCNDRAMVIHWTNKPDYLIKNIYVLHNTLFSNEEGIDVGVHSLGRNINIINNIFSQNLNYQIQNSSDDLNPDELKIKNNTLYGINPSWALFGDNYSISDPEFIATSTYDFHLQSTSPAINQGAYLTRTLNSETGTIIALEDAGFFTNGYGINEGDTVQFEGQTQQFKIIDIDYVNNTITLNAIVSCNIGDGVSLKYLEDVPDMGAFEYNSSIGLDSNTIASSIIYPNPTKDIFYVADKYLNHYYQIVSLTGKIVKNGKIDSADINISALDSGIYFFVVFNRTSKNSVVSKLIKN